MGSPEPNQDDDMTDTAPSTPRSRSLEEIPSLSHEASSFKSLAKPLMTSQFTKITLSPPEDPQSFLQSHYHPPLLHHMDSEPYPQKRSLSQSQPISRIPSPCRSPAQPSSPSHRRSPIAHTQKKLGSYLLEDTKLEKKKKQEKALSKTRALSKSLTGLSFQEYSTLLPSFTHSSKPQFPMVTPETVAKLIQNGFPNVTKYFILDCRYTYEFDGGHIVGAVRISSEDDLKRMFFDKPKVDEKVAILFHCEFSSQRGPDKFETLRKLDRIANMENYPKLFYPDVYLIQGGYSAFFRKYPDLCEPRDYVEMHDRRFIEDCKKQKGDYKRRKVILQTDYSSTRTTPTGIAQHDITSPSASTFSILPTIPSGASLSDLDNLFPDVVGPSPPSIQSILNVSQGSASRSERHDMKPSLRSSRTLFKLFQTDHETTNQKETTPGLFFDPNEKNENIPSFESLKQTPNQPFTSFKKSGPSGGHSQKNPLMISQRYHSDNILWHSEDEKPHPTFN
uniref:protein-tyrosine-phosphatase n=1 Tax=Arcella intermedia TaxID=1963864 RepID=A0A6B2L1Z2_9EUKA